VGMIEAAAAATGLRVLLQSSWTDMKKPAAAAAAAGDAEGTGDKAPRVRKRDMLWEFMGGTVQQSLGGTPGSLASPASPASPTPAAGAAGRQLLFHVGAVPHEWLFRHVAAVVHHGGAGTVAAGLRAGRPSAVCPFFGDQYFWAMALERAKVRERGKPARGACAFSPFF